MEGINFLEIFTFLHPPPIVNQNSKTEYKIDLDRQRRLRNYLNL